MTDKAAYMREYHKRPENQAKRKLYRQLPKVKEYERSYAKSERGKAVRKKAAYKYHQSIKGRLKRLAHERSLAGRFRSSKYKAKSHGQTWLMRIENYAKLISQDCFYCNGSLHPTGIGLDRLDNSKGYEETNVVPCCKNCNLLRGDRLTPEETRIAVDAIKDYRASKANSNIVPKFEIANG